MGMVGCGLWAPPHRGCICTMAPESSWLSYPLLCLYIPQIKESHWEAESLDKEGLSESVRSCESHPGV